jgi:GH15 family glucan-1,4-alpha-glucosidase
MQAPSPIPYPALRAHGLIGDRRTAALVAADGTLDWLCLPDYDGDVFLGALLDARKGGYWRLGPAARLLGKQSYLDATAALLTAWDLDGRRLELTDYMAWPADQRPDDLQHQRVVLRRLRCVRGQYRCCLQLSAACNFEPAALKIVSPTQAHIRAASLPVRLWISRPILEPSSEVNVSFDLQEGDECWAVLAAGHAEEDWSVDRAKAVRAGAETYWKRWSNELNYHGKRAREVRLSARLVHLLSYAPSGSVVAAATTSLPERIGGDWNADYRLSWVRDASLSLAILSLLGNTADSRRYLGWLCGLGSSTEAPLQVLYGIRGETEPKPHERSHLYGYRGSRPVRFGNHAFRQYQHDAFGYLIDGAYHFVQQGGRWEPEFSDLIRRVAHRIADAWDKPDNSIWELSEQRNYLSGKVMSWVALDRAVKLAPQLGHSEDLERWRSIRDAIRNAVLTKGWSESLSAFRQHFEADNLDAAALLIPIMGFLPPDEPRVMATVERIAEQLTCDGFVYRFDPKKTPGFAQQSIPMGELEGAFLPCTFWLATAYAQMGRRDRAEAILSRVEACAATNGLFAEGVDPRTGDMRGNMPLLFSHSEYVRAVLALEDRLPPS